MSGPDPEDNNRVLYLEEIRIETTTKVQFRVKLLVEGSDIRIEHDEQTSTWTPFRSLELTHVSDIMVIVKTGRSIAGISIGKQDARVETSGQEAMEAFWDSTDLILNTTFANRPITVTLKLRPSYKLDTAREHIVKVKEDMKKYKSLMDGSTEQHIETIVKYGVVFAELNPMSKMAFGLVRVTLDLLKEQTKYDNMVSDLAANIGRILQFAERTLDNTLCDEAETLQPLVKKLFDLIVEAATFICGYAKRSPTNRLFKSSTILKDREKVESLQTDFKILNEDLDRAVSGAMLKALSNMEKGELLKRLDPVDKASYHKNRGCMDGTRTATIDYIVSWAVKPNIQSTPSTASNTDNVLWVYGMPGIGKTCLANSICHKLRNNSILGGSFFCRRDDSVLAEPERVLPTLIYRLAGVFGPYRNTVAQILSDDPQINPGSESDEILLRSMENLKRHPSRALVLVIDALDECGTPDSRRQLLKPLFEACRRVNWLKLIVTSRPESDINSSFKANRTASHDLAEDDQTGKDILYFMGKRMESLMESRGLPNDWPGEPRREKIITRSHGLFIYIDTLCRFLGAFKDPDVPLDQLLAGQLEEDNAELHKLYSIAITSRIGREVDKFQSIVRAIIVVATYRPLCDETLAALMGEKPRVVKAWVDELSAILYRDVSQNGGIRVRHLSILEFFTSSSCPPEIRVDMKQANAELGRYCLKIMIKELKFNICELETSCLPNSEVKDLVDRVQGKISDALKYSCLNWSSHLSFDSDLADDAVCRLMKAFFAGVIPLYWLEVLSVMGNVPVAIPALELIEKCNKKFDAQIRDKIEDLLHFTLAFSTPISISTPHIYISALPFMPIQSGLWHRIYRVFPKLLDVCTGRTQMWPGRLGVWYGHDGPVDAVAYSPNGQHIVSGSRDHKIRIWNVKRGRTVGEPLKGHTDLVRSVAYSPNGQYIVSGSGDKTIRIWDASTGAPVNELLGGHTGPVTSVAYSPNGQHIISGSGDKTIRIWDATTGVPVGEPLRGHTDLVSSVTYSPNGQYIVSGSSDNTIRIWDATTGTIVGEPLEGHTGSVISIAYSPDGRHIISGSGDRTVRIWDANTRVPVGEPLKGHTKFIKSVAYSPNGQDIVSGSYDNTVRIWDATTGAPVGEPLKGHTRSVTVVAYSPDGRHIVSGSVDETVRIWDASTGAPVGELLEGHTGPVESVAYSSNGQHIISGSGDNTIRIWDATTGVPVGGPLRGHTDLVSSVTYSPNGQYIVSGSDDKTVRIWDAITGIPVDKPLEGHTKPVTSVAYSPNGQYIVSGSYDNTVRIWDASTGAPVGRPLRRHMDMVNSVAYSPNGQHIISGSDDKMVWITSVSQPLRGHMAAVNSVAYSPNGQHIISGSGDNTIRIWDATTGVPMGEPLRGHTDLVCSVTYSPNSQHIVSGSSDNTIRIWDATTGTIVGEPLRGHTSWVVSVAYSPNGRHIVSGSDDHTIRFWDTTVVPKCDANILQDTQALSSFLTRGQASVSIHSPTEPTPSGFAIAQGLIDSSGWVYCNEGLLFWVPEDCRNGLSSSAILTIPTTGRHKCVRVNFDNFRYGSAWTTIRGDA